MIAHTQGQNTFVDAKTWSIENKVLKSSQIEIRLLILEHSMNAYIRLLVDWLDDKAFVIERNVANFGPREANLWSELVVSLVDVQSKSVNTQVQFSSFLVADFKVLN
jgi:hypothetical protein